VEIHVSYNDLPPLFIEPNELFGVLVTILRLAMETLEAEGGLIEVQTYVPTLSTDGQQVCTEVYVPEAPLRENVSGVLEPVDGASEELSPLHFEWALAQETAETQYEGSLTWEICDGGMRFLLELPSKGS
jgi:hypothetical protein